jgi:glutamate-ammonia-ligase adenylyltransferase
MTEPGNKPAGDESDAQALLRRTFRASIFAIGARDVLTPRAALDSMRDASSAADQAIHQALQMVNGTKSLAIFALGRLGTQEFDIASDADLLFVSAPEADVDEARLDAERLVHTLAAYTREGSIFAVDARLRPRGGEGELVVAPEQVCRYLEDEAQPWEALTYTKLRFVAGREDLAPAFLTQVWHQIVEMATRPGFAEAVADMRLRLEKSNRYPNSFKLARGGFCDIDFLASYLMLRHGSLAQGNTLERLEHLRQQEFLSPSNHEILRDAALLYRTADHAIRLVTERAQPELPAEEHAQQAVEKLVGRILRREGGQDLQTDLRETAGNTREIFVRIVPGSST